MQDDLDLVKQWLEEECLRLREELQTSLQLMDYASATALQDALQYTEQHLRSIQALGDPHFDQKDQLRRSIRMMESILSYSGGKNHPYGEGLKKRLEEYRQALRDLLSLPAPSSRVSTELVEGLDHLLRREYKQLALVFPQNYLRIDFIWENRELVGKLCGSRPGDAVSDLIPGSSSQLTRMGFGREGRQFQMIIPLDWDLSRLLTWCSQLTLGVLQLNGDSEAFMSWH